MKKIILFEGFDNTGKSTLAKALSEKLNISYFKTDRQKDFDSKSEYNQELDLKYSCRTLLELIENNIINEIILDRNYVSEYVYGSIFRKELYKKYNIEKYIWLYDRRFKLQNLKIIFCYKNIFKKFNDNLVELKQETVVQQKYLEFSKKTVNELFLLNTEDEKIDVQLNKIIHFLNYEK